MEMWNVISLRYVVDGSEVLQEVYLPMWLCIAGVLLTAALLYRVLR